MEDRLGRQENGWLRIGRLASWIGSSPVRAIRASPDDGHPSGREDERVARDDAAGEGRMKVRDVLHAEVATVAPGDSIRAAAAIMVERGVSGLPVVEADGGIVGVISEGDIVAKEIGPSLGSRRWMDVLLHKPDPELTARLEARSVRDAMSEPALTVEPDASVARAAELMVEHGVNRLPVVERGRLVGIVSRADLVRAFARSDAEIASEIEKDVVERGFWLEPGSVGADVEAGNVVLTGEVESRSMSELLARVVERVPGVVSVESRLTWRDAGRR